MYSQRIKIFLLALAVIISFIMIFPQRMNRHVKAENNLNTTALADSEKEIASDSATNEIIKMLPQVPENFFKLKPTLNNN
jgi:hypothetical protein